MNKIEELRQQILAHNPTQQQQKAIFSEDLEFLLHAAPGSGKTWTSCRRFIWRGANWHHKIGGLALLSFTNTAVQEFRKEIMALDQYELLSDPNFIGTFDSFVERFILVPFGHLIAASKMPIKLINNEDIDQQQLWIKIHNKNIPYFPSDLTPRRIKTNNQTITQFEIKNYGKYISYKDGIRILFPLIKQGFYTHSQRCFWACYLLSNNQNITKVLAAKFPEVIVDEAQDSNPWLLILLNFMRDRGTKVTLVGDPDQCIYEFNLASATSLDELKRRWNFPEYTLSQSFRFHDFIANSVKNIGFLESLTGTGNPPNVNTSAFIFRDESNDYSNSLNVFLNQIKLSNNLISSSAVICRGKKQLNSLRGDGNYTKLIGKTSALAKAIFYRDYHHAYYEGYTLFEDVLRDLILDSDFWSQVKKSDNCDINQNIRVEIWSFFKSRERLPSLELSAEEWIQKLRISLRDFSESVGANPIQSLNQKLTLRGIATDQKANSLFVPNDRHKNVRYEIIHQVKGESIDSVLVLGDARRFWTPVVKAVEKGENSEVRRLAYVAMTRARHLLVLGLPASHFDKYKDSWIGWGFRILE